MASRAKSESRRFRAPLEFPGGLTQVQWCVGTLQRLEKDLQKTQSPLHAEHPSVIPLLSGLLSTCIPSVQAVCSVLVDATARGMIVGDPVIKNLVSSCASMPNWAIGIDAVGQIMTNRVLENSGSYACPYSLRTSPHPFISIANSRPECGLYISDVVIQMLRNSLKSNCFENVLQLLSPVLKYFLVHPLPSSEHAFTSSHLYMSLLTLVQTFHVEQSDKFPSLAILRTLTALLPLTPSHQQHILTLSNRIERLTSVWSTCKFGDGVMMTELVDACLAVCCNRMEAGLPLNSLLSCVLHLVTSSLKVQLLGRHIFCLSWLMLQSLLVPTTVSLMMKIVLEIAEKKPQPFVLLIALPVVQVLSLPNTSQHGSPSAVQNAANRLMQVIQESATYNWTSGGESESLKLPLHYRPYPLFNSLADTFSTIMCSSLTIVTWLNEISEELRLSKMPTFLLEMVALMLSALFIRTLNMAGDDEDVLLLVFRAFCELTKVHPIISPSLLPLFLYFLPLVRSQSCKLSLLYTLPSLATHPLAVGPTVNVLRILGGNSSLIPISLRLLGNLWRYHDFVYPHVLSLLEQKMHCGATSVNAAEFEVAKAAVINDICCIRGEQHGEELLSHISFIIEHSNQPLAIALAIDALAALCRTDVVDPVTVWSVLGQRLAGDSRIAVAVASCSILSLATSVDSELRSAAKNFKTTALKHLWKMVFSPNSNVCSSALEALSNFRLSDFVVEYLPPEVLQSLSIPSPVIDRFADIPAEPIEAPLSAGYCVHLVTVLPQQSLGSLSSFLQALLPCELEAIPRGIISLALQQSQSANSLEKAARGVENVLNGMCLANHDKDSLYGLVSGTTVMLHGAVSLAVPGVGRDRGGQIAVKEMNKYSGLLEDILRSGHICLEVRDGIGIESTVSCLLLPRYWALFMKKVCDTFTKAWIVRRCPVSIWEDPAGLNEESLEARDWAKQELVKKLAEFSSSSPVLAPNLLLALVGIACATTFTSHSSGVLSTEPISAWSYIHLLQLTIQGVQSLIMGNELEHFTEHPVTALLSALRGHVEDSILLLSCPILVESILRFNVVPPLPLYTALETLAYSVWSHFNKCPLWYTGIVLNEILLMLLQRLHKVKSIVTEFIPFAEAAVQSQSMELLSLVSSFLPSLHLAGQNNTALGVLNSTTAALQSASPEELEMYHGQISSLHVANFCSFLYSTGILSDEESMQYVTMLADLATKTPHVPTYHLCLATVLHGLLAAFHPNVQQLADAVAVRWIRQLSDQSSPDVLSLLWGLAGLCGINPIAKTLWYDESYFPVKFVETLFPVVRDVFGKLSEQASPNIAINITWLLGHIYHNLIHTLNNMEKVPMNYSYLSENALLPTLISVTSGSLCDKVQRCLLSVLSSVKDTLPPCDLSSVIIPLVKRSELQVNCVQLLVNQSHKMMGLKCLATHIFNMMLRGCLLIEAQFILLENLPCCLCLVPIWKYLHPLCNTVLQLYPGSQELLCCLLKGLKGVMSVHQDAPSGKHYGIEVGYLVKEVWERVCGEGRICEVLNGEGKMLMKLLADCLWMVECKPITSEVSFPLTKVAFNCLLQCCWVESEKEGVSSLNSLLSWTLQNDGTEASRVITEKLVQVIRQICFNTKPKKVLLWQTQLLHTAVVWSRENKTSVSQMKKILFFSLVTTSPTPPMFTKMCAVELEPWLASFSLPNGPLLQEKLLQCLLEWFVYNDDDVHKICLSMLEHFIATIHYATPLVWMSVAHLL